MAKAKKRKAVEAAKEAEGAAVEADDWEGVGEEAEVAEASAEGNKAKEEGDSAGSAVKKTADGDEYIDVSRDHHHLLLALHPHSVGPSPPPAG